MSIFKTPISLDILNNNLGNNMTHHLGIVFTEFGDDFLSAKMPIDHRTTQPYGILHGGASVVLAETLGSVAGYFCVDISKQRVVGLEINANHIRGVREGFVYGTTKPIHIGSKTQIWSIEIKNEEGKMVCISRITLAVLDNEK
jgi:1,4-dihydroxy-2-naphthoyl-CoA hydrolase